MKAVVTGPEGVRETQPVEELRVGLAGIGRDLGAGLQLHDGAPQALP